MKSVKMASFVDHVNMGEEESNEKISLHLSKVLDMMGYSRQMVQARKDSYQEWDNIHNATHRDYTFVTSGSKGEGLTKAFESDIDYIYLHKNVIATEEDLINVVPPNMSIFTFRSDYSRPGYNLLALHSLGPRRPESLEPSLRQTSTGTQILSSKAIIGYAEAIERKHNVLGQKQVHGCSGPAIAYSLVGQELDRVYSIPSVCPTVLMEWLHRPRQYDWPPIDLCQRIVRMRGNFVAKGSKQSPMEEHEWRQCFNQAELLLIHSLGEMLHKLYTLLKIILKDILRPLDSETVLSSFVMKNIVFWLAETNPTDAFQEKYLIKWLLKALRMLKHSLESRFLPYYMIPARNLLEPGMKTRDRKRLLWCVNRLVRQGPRALYKCEKMQYTTKMTHNELSQFGAQRDELEMMHLSSLDYVTRLINQGLSFEQILCDETFRAISRRRTELINSSWPPNLKEDMDKCENEWDCTAAMLK